MCWGVLGYRCLDLVVAGLGRLDGDVWRVHGLVCRGVGICLEA